MEKRWTWWKIILYIWAAAWPIGLCVGVFSLPMTHIGEGWLRVLTVVAAVLVLIGLICGIIKKSSIVYFIIPFAGVILGVLCIKDFVKENKDEEERRKNTVRCGKCGESYVAYHNNSCKICGSFDVIHSYDMGSQVFCKKCDSYRPGTYRCPHCGADRFK